MNNQPSQTQEQLASLIRLGLGGLAGYAVGKSWISNELANAALPVAVAAVPTVWAILKNRRAARRRRAS